MERETAGLGVAEHAALVREGEATAREVVEAALRRIDRHDRELRAFSQVFHERALADAEAIDASADRALALLGVPVAIKDDTDVAGAVTTWGTSAAGGPATEDAPIVAALRAAGAVVVGKTTVPELTTSGFTETPTFGATRNPWNLGRTPGGSSGGSAAALAAGLVPLATATDGLGSTRIPAAYCGFYGLKPSSGRVALSPASVDRWFGLLCVGPYARSVSDTALAFDTMLRTPSRRPFAEAAADRPGRLRIAVSTKVPPGAMPKAMHPDCAQAMQATAALLSDLGHDVYERDPDYGLGVVDAISRYLRGVHEDAAALPHPERLSRRTRTGARIGGLVPRAAIARLRASEAQTVGRILALWEDADVLLTPVHRAPAFPVGRFDGAGPVWTLMRTAADVPHGVVFNLTGQPAASVPAGLDRDGMPIGVQLVGRPGDEDTLLMLSAQLEEARPWPAPPLRGEAPVGAPA